MGARREDGGDVRCFEDDAGGGREGLTFWDARERERETDDVYYVRVAIGMDE